MIVAAERAQFELIVLNNRYDGHVAIGNAKRLVKERVDLGIVKPISFGSGGRGQVSGCQHSDDCD